MAESLYISISLEFFSNDRWCWVVQGRDLDGVFQMSDEVGPFADVIELFRLAVALVHALEESSGDETTNPRQLRLIPRPGPSTVLHGALLSRDGEVDDPDGRQSAT